MLLNKKVFAVSILTSLISSNVNAGGFALIENGASGMGNAYAGASAVAEDASTIYFNPAGLSKLDGQQILLAGHFISSKNAFTNNGSTIISAFGGTAQSGGNAAAGSNSFIPTFFYSRKLNNKWSYGFGVTVPFGAAVEYSDTWVGRYHGVNTEISTLNINPSASFKVNDKFSVGFGISAQYIEATISNKIDSAAYCQGGLKAGALCNANNLTVANISNATYDSGQTLSGDDWSMGWNIGLLYDLTESTKIGVSYRSKIVQALVGSVDFTVNSNLQTVLDHPAVNKALLQDTGISAGITLPESFSLSLSHVVNEKWQLLADATWMRWERYNEVVIDFNNPVQANSTLSPNNKNQWRYSIGASFKADAKQIYRVGVALDKTSVRSPAARLVRGPSNDRLWLSFGYGNKISDTLSFDIGYAHLFINDPTIANSHVLFGTINGSFEQAADILSTQVSWHF